MLVSGRRKLAKMILKLIRRVFFVTVTYAFVYTLAFGYSFCMTLNLFRLWFRSSKSNNFFWSKRRELPPRCLSDPAYGEHRYTQIKNIRLHYVEKGDKSKPLMLFLHGFPEFWYSWRYQIKYFSKYYWTVAVDLRGYGDSEKPVGVSQYQIKYIIKDIKNLIEALGKDKCILVGHDWGCVLGWQVIFNHSELIDRYVMIGIPPFFSITNSLTQLYKSLYVFSFQIPVLPENYFHVNDFEMFDDMFREQSEEDKEAYKFTFGKPGALTFPLNYYRANILAVAANRRKPQNVKWPKGLFIYTDNDAYILITEEHVKNLPENAHAAFIKKGSHFMHQNRSDEMNEIIAKFLGLTDTDDHGHAKSVQSNDVNGTKPAAEVK